MKKIIVVLFIIAVLVGIIGNNQNVKNLVNDFNNGEYSTDKPKAIAYAMMDSGLDAEVLDVLGCTIQGCTAVNGVLLKIGEEEEEVSLFYITNKTEYDRAVRLYEDMNRLYENIGVYYRIHQNGKVLLISGGSHSEESFKAVAKQLDYVMR